MDQLFAGQVLKKHFKQNVLRDDFGVSFLKVSFD